MSQLRLEIDKAEEKALYFAFLLGKISEFFFVIP